MNFLITPVGSAGDNYPFIGLGVELARRGHRVTVFSNEHFEPLIRRCGLEFVQVGTDEEYRQTIADPMIWHPTRGFEFVMKMVAEQNQRLMEATESQIDSDTAVISHTLDFVSRARAEKTGLPVVTVHLSPLIVRTNYDIGVISGTTNLSPWPRWLKRILWNLSDRFMVDPAGAPVVNATRAKLGLPPVRRILQTALHSPLLTVGMWPAWFSAYQPDYPPFFKLTGFPLFDGAEAQPVPAEVEEFIAAHGPPVVFTPGSANVHGHQFFQAAAGAARRLDRPIMLLSRFDEHLPADLNDRVRHFAFAPLSKILSSCAALVHHGGIGTTAAALAGGVPQVIMPMSHDQPNNAHWVRELGAGDRLMPKKFTGRRVAAMLQDLLESPEVKASCARAARRCAEQDAIGQTVDLIESAVRRGARTENGSPELAVPRG